MANNRPTLLVTGGLDKQATKKQMQAQLDKLGGELKLTIGVGKNGTQDISKQAKSITDLTKANKGYINGLNNLLHLMKTKQITDDKALANLNKLRQNQQFANLTQQKQIALVNAMEKANNNYTKSVDTATNTQKKYNEEIKKTNQLAKDAQSKQWQGRFEENLKATTTPNAGLKSMSDYYKQQEKMFGTEDEFSKLSASLDVQKKITQQKMEEYSLVAKKYRLTEDQKTQLQLEKNEIQSILKTQAMTTKEIERQNNALKIARSNMQSIVSEAKATGRTALNPKEYITGAIQATAGWFTATTIFYQSIRAIQSGVQTIFEFDKAMTELRKVSEESNESLVAFGETAEKIGAQVGRTSTEVVQATSDFVKMGYSLRQASEMAKDALILTNVGDGFTDVAQASEALVTTLKGFNLDASETTHIIDSLNELSNKYAVNSVDLAEALKRSSAVMALSGNTFEETLAMYTSGIEILQSPEKVSRGLTTISQRLRGMSEEGEKITALVPKLQETFDMYAKGIKITADDGSLRSTYDILTDLSRVWGTLTSKQQQYVGELVAGKDQVKTLAAVLQNKKVLLEANTVALTSSGSALKENDIYLQSLEGRVKSFNQALEQLWKGTIDGGFIKAIISLATGLVKVVDELNLLQVGVVALTTVMASSLIPTLFTTTGHFTKLFAVLRANPLVLLASAVAGVVFWLNEQENVTEKLISSSQEIVTSIKDETDESVKLAQAVEDLSNTQNRTYEESVKLKEAKAELIKLYPELKSIIESETTKQGELEQAIRKVTSARVADSNAGLKAQRLMLATDRARTSLQMQNLQNRLSKTVDVGTQVTLQGEINALQNVYDNFDKQIKAIDSQMKVVTDLQKEIASPNIPESPYAEDPNPNARGDEKQKDKITLLTEIEKKLRDNNYQLQIQKELESQVEGKERIPFIKKQIELFKQRQDLIHQQAEASRKELATLQSKKNLSDKDKKRMEELEEVIQSMGIEWNTMNTNIVSANKNIADINKEISDKLAKEIEEANEKTKKALEETKDALKEIIDLTSDELKKAFEDSENAIEKEAKASEDYYNSKIDSLKSEMQLEDEKNEILEDQIAKQEKLLALAKLKEERANILSQRNVRFLGANGWEFIADPQALKENAEKIADAEKDLAKFEADLKIKESKRSTEQQIRDLEVQRDKEKQLFDRRKEDFKFFSDSILEQFKSSNGLTVSEQTNLYNQLIANDKTYWQNKLAYVTEMASKIRSAQYNLASVSGEVGYSGSMTGEYKPSVTTGGIHSAPSNGMTEYADGGLMDYTGLAKIHGSKAIPELALNSQQIANVSGMLGISGSPAEMASKLYNTAKSGINNAMGGSITIGNISLPNVSNASQFVKELQRLRIVNA